MSDSASCIGHQDVFTQVSQYADDSTLSIAMRLSWAHFDLAGKLLYEHLTIDPNHADSLSRGASSGALILYDGTERELKKSLFDYVKRVNLVNHQCESWGRTACSRWREANINLPNLQTVQIWRGAGWSHCTWERTLTPRKIILIGMHCPYSIELQSCISHPSLPSFTHITLIIDELADNTKENRRLLRSSSKTQVPFVRLHEQLEVVVIFRTGREARPTSTSLPLLVGDIKLENLMDQLAILALTPVKRLEICNAGEYLADRQLPQQKIIDIETRVRRRIEEITKRRSEGKLLAARLDQLCFVDREMEAMPR